MIPGPLYLLQGPLGLHFPWAASVAEAKSRVCKLACLRKWAHRYGIRLVAQWLGLPYIFHTRELGLSPHQELKSHKPRGEDKKKKKAQK